MTRTLALIAALALTAGQARADAFSSTPPPPQPNTVTSGSGLMNVSAPNLPNWRKAVAKVRAGTGRGRLVILGDSTTAGSGAGTGGSTNQNGAFAVNYPRALIALLNANGIPAADGSFYDDQRVTVYATYDTRVVFGTGWTNTANSLAGQMFKFTVGASGTLSFTPTGAFDTIVVRYLQQGSQGSFTTNIDGGASLGTTSATGGAILASTTFSVAKGTHTVNLVADNLNPLFIEGITTSDSTVPAVDVIQTAWHGGNVGNFTTTGLPYSPMTALATLAPDLTIIGLTINDSNNGTTLAAYTTGLQTIITQAKVTGDCLLLVGPPSSSTQATDGTLDGFIAVMKALGLANNCGVVDLKTRWVSYAVTNPVIPYFDTLHPTAVGYRDVAAAVWSAIGAP